MSVEQVTRGFAEAVQCAARVPALEAEVERLRILVEELQKRDANASAPRRHDARRVLRWPEVLGMVGVSRSTINRWINAGKFPPPKPLGSRMVGWSAAVIVDWCESRGLAGDSGDSDSREPTPPW